MRLVAVVGPSGAGKDTLMELACAADPQIRLVRRVITRPASAGGEVFEGVTGADFDQRLLAGQFALHWQAHGLQYGIPVSELCGNGILLFNCSRGTLAEAQSKFPALQVVLVTAPPAVLAARLTGRGREDRADQAARLARANFTMPASVSAVEVMNDGTAEQGLARFMAALQAERV